jgi:drug/metabolite transporter (DMT)-like permease
LFAIAVWGASFVATKAALVEASPATIVWLRFAMGTAVLAFATARRGELAPVGRRDLAYFAGLGLLGITLHQWLQSTGLVTAQATTSAWIVTTSPVFLVLLGRLVLGERLGGTRLAGVGIAALGVLLVVTRGDFGAIFAGSIGVMGRFGSRGDLLVLLSSVNWAVVTVLSRRGLASHPAARMTLYTMGFGWLFATPWLLAGPGFAEIGRLGPRGWTAVVFLGIFCSSLAYIGWYDALKAIPAARLSVFLYLEPLVTMILALGLGQERWSVVPLLGGAVIVLGVVLVNRRPRLKAG